MKKQTPFKPGWWVFVLGRDEDKDESRVLSLDLKMHDMHKDARNLKLEALQPKTFYTHVHYAVIDTRFILTPEHLKETTFNYELAWHTTLAQNDEVALRLEIEKLRGLVH